MRIKVFTWLLQYVICFQLLVYQLFFMLFTSGSTYVKYHFKTVCVSPSSGQSLSQQHTSSFTLCLGLLKHKTTSFPEIIQNKYSLFWIWSVLDHFDMTSEAL